MKKIRGKVYPECIGNMNAARNLRSTPFAGDAKQLPVGFAQVAGITRAFESQPLPVANSATSLLL